jgi:hypothetical protein
MVSEEVARTGIIVADGEYERYLEKKADDDCPDRCHDHYAGCSGKCGVAGEACGWHQGRNRHGHWVEWCMCGSKTKSLERFAAGLSVARDYLPEEVFGQYEARIRAMLEAK